MVSTIIVPDDGINERFANCKVKRCLFLIYFNITLVFQNQDMNTVTIELINHRALQLLQDLEAMHIIKLHHPETKSKTKLSDKYRGILSKKDGKDLSKHINQMRSEWNNS